MRSRFVVANAAFLLVLSSSTPAADVFIYETRTARGTSPEAACRAWSNVIVESEERTYCETCSYPISCRLYKYWGADPTGKGCYETHLLYRPPNPPNLCYWLPTFELPPTDPGYRGDAYAISARPVADEDRALGHPPGACELGNPCDPATGNKIQVEVDYVGSGPFPLRFARTYNWLSKSITGTVGEKWRHNYDRRLGVNPSGDGIAAFRDDGAVLKFQRVGGGWSSVANVTDRLEDLANGGWKLTLSDGDLVETYDVGGKLLTIANRAGVTQTLSYFTTGPNAGMLRQVEDHFGRTIQFAYTIGNLLASITDPAGALVRYEYDTLLRLTAAVYPDSTPADSTDDPRRTYVSSNDNSAALVGIRDENGVLFASFAYNGGLASETKHAGDAGRIRLSYPSPTSTIVTSYVTPTVTATRTYSFQSILGVKYTTSISGDPCPACGPKSQTFDTSTGFRTSSTDWNGNRIQYTHDARGLETLRVEAAGSPQERRITTDWHSSYRLPVRIAEPLRITAYVYGEPSDPNPGNRGSVLSKTIQPTSDASGAQGLTATPIGVPRTLSYTYNAEGQVLTIDGPRIDVEDVTTYTYHPNDDPDVGKRGGLATITNALGHTTQITAYDTHGKPLTIVDPNGLVTTLTYDARQRLTSRTVGGESTSYEYDRSGQLIRVTLPDSSFLVYSYDEAHRLIQIADNLGNRIAYALDLMGNRVREDVFDAANQLAQTRSRVYSNLNRLAQEIGGTIPAAQITRYAYDDQGNVTSITDPLSRETKNAYDGLSRLIQVTDPGLGVTRYAYDRLDQLTQVTDPRNNPTGYALDGLGNLSVQSSPDTGGTSNAHDAAGNLISSTDAKGQSAAYAYDALNRVTRTVYNDATQTQLKQIDYQYGGGANDIGRLTAITETSAAGAVLQTMTYSYDQRGRIT
ncbi:MAG TPA: DUF6531 domain-containing protein, partial [Gemmatimonadales bacterium]|nr:DUF6531 domain-containing protein [Gemmatimonadales bacterium]